MAEVGGTAGAGVGVKGGVAMRSGGVKVDDGVSLDCAVRIV